MSKLDKVFTDNAIQVLERRYLAKDAQGNTIETPEEMFHRVAKAVASADRKYGKNPEEIYEIEEMFYNAMTDLEFMPNSPTLMNAGRELGQLSACFVLPIEDSMESIFETIKQTAMIHKTGGGTGFSFSRLRPKSSVVKTTGGVASGPVSFMKVFDSATQAVKQGGTRRGANMGIIRVDHPDVLEFITCKENDNQINNFNISIAVTDEFMKKVETGKEYDLIDPHTKKKVDSLNAKEVFELICNMVWKNGEPGVIFIDRMNENNPTSKLGEIESTNPCGEQPLLPYESCNLGSINLSKMVIEEVSEYKIDWDRLANVTQIATRFLDNVIDINRFPLKQIEEYTKRTRKIGLGVMGWADLLTILNVAYNSDEAVSLAEEVMGYILEIATQESVKLAKGKGTFPAFEESTFNAPDKPRVRNATLTTIAPTGTISIISGCSGGIEPLFALAYTRHVMDDDKLQEINPYFEKIAKDRGFYSKELIDEIIEKGSCHEVDDVPDDVKAIFVTSHDITPEWHIKMQVAFQKYTHNAVSKTINFPEDANVEDVKKSYLQAFETGCKGITIYRDKSRCEQVLNIDSKKSEGTKQEIDVNILPQPRPRPKVTVGTTTKITTGCGNLYITINEDDIGLPFEVFMQMGKAGGCAASQLEAIGRLVSLALRSDMDIKTVISQLRGIRCPTPSWEKGSGRIFSCADAIAQVLERRLGKESDNIDSQAASGVHQHLPEETISEVSSSQEEANMSHRNIVGVCPDCGSALRHEEGCMKCMSPGCGYSRC